MRRENSESVRTVTEMNIEKRRGKDQRKGDWM